jgi:hypothetical protein
MNDKKSKISTTSKSDNNNNNNNNNTNEYNRASIEIQKINEANTNKNNPKNYSQILNEENNNNNLKSKKQQQSFIHNKSISPRIQKTVFSLLNSSNQKSRLSKSPAKNRRRKFDESGEYDGKYFESFNNEDDQYGDGVDKENEDYDDDDDDDNMNITTNYDKDDSLLDVESLGKQTPFRMDSVDASFSVFGGVGGNVGFSNVSHVLASLDEEPIKIKTRLSKNRNKSKKIKQNENNDSNDENINNKQFENQKENFFQQDDNFEEFDHYKKHFSDTDEGFDFDHESPYNNKNNKNRYSLIETEYFQTENNNNNDDDDDYDEQNDNNMFQTGDTGYQGTLGGTNSSLLNKIVSKNPLVKNKNLSFAKKLNLIENEEEEDDDDNFYNEQPSFNETDTIDEILLIADDGKVEDLEKEYKKLKREERVELKLKQQQENENKTNKKIKFDLYSLENEALSAFQNSVDLYNNDNNTLYDLPGRFNDDFSQSYTFDLPEHILSNTKTEPVRSHTPSRIPTPVRNKSSFRTSTTTGHYNNRLHTNPSPLTIGSRIPVLVAATTSRPQSRAEMYTPVNEQQPKLDAAADTSCSELLELNDKKMNRQQENQTEIQSSVIDQIYFKRSENFNDSGNKNETELSNLLDEGLPDKMFEASILTGGAITNRTNNDTSLENIKRSFDDKMTALDVTNQNEQLQQPNTQNPNNVAGAFKFYTAFADDILADTGDLDNEDISISYDAVLNKLNSNDNEKHHVLKGDEENEQKIKNVRIADDYKKSKSPVKFQTKQNSHSTSPFISIEKQEKNPRKTPTSVLKSSKTSQQQQQQQPKQQSTIVQQPQLSQTTSSKSKRDPMSSSMQALSNNRPPTREVTYSIDSEEASITENSKLDLKSILKEEQKRRKMTDELLDQLQTNYDRLLEKHALAENVIDSLRLGAKLQIHQDVTPNTMIQQVILVFFFFFVGFCYLMVNFSKN